MLRWIRRIVVGFLAILGAGTLVFFVIGLSVTWGLIAHRAQPVPPAAVLKLDLTKPLADASEQDRLLAALSGQQVGLREIERALDRAGRDPRVKGLVVQIGESIPLATTQALRDAITAFRKQGKFAIAFAENYDELSSGVSQYYLATAFEEIWLQPSGEVGLAGLIAETMFLRGTFDKLGVVPHFDKREEYKNAVNELTDTRYDSAFRESLESLLSSLYGQVVRGIADGRAMTPDAVRGLIDEGPYLADAALKAKLVDRLGYLDEIESDATTRAGPGAKLITLSHYLRASDEPKGGTVIATVDAEGAITSGDSDGLFGVAQSRAGAIAKALDEASRATDVAAIVFRIDSPGGSYTASDTIRRAVEKARKAGKPVIVSMGDVAASGGYFAALPANKIVAEPATLTGSIGVFAGKFVLAGLYDKLGLSVDSIQLGKNVGMWSGNRDFSDSAWAKLEAMLDAIYADFTGKVAAARGLDPGRIPAVAKGRVWTGEEARELGLVDALGGFSTAVGLARDALGLAADAPVRFRAYPRPGEALSQLLDNVFGIEKEASSSLLATLAPRLAAALGGKAALLHPLLVDLPALTAPGDAYMLMPPLEVR
jgi:protease-4